MWRAVKKNMVSLLLFETGYRTASFLLVMHAVSAAVDYSLKAQNFSYLTAENYLKFLASPLSVVLLLGILILILLLFHRDFRPFILFQAFLPGTENLYQRHAH